MYLFSTSLKKDDKIIYANMPKLKLRSKQNIGALHGVKGNRESCYYFKAELGDKKDKKIHIHGLIFKNMSRRHEKQRRKSPQLYHRFQHFPGNFE